MSFWLTTLAILVGLVHGTIATTATIGEWPAPPGFDPADGIYTAVALPDGTFNITYLGPIVADFAEPRRHLDRRDPQTKWDDTDAKPNAPSGQYAGIYCDDIGLVPGNAEASNEALIQLCHLGGIQRTVWVKSGEVVSFYCHVRNQPQCTEDSFKNALYMIYDQCGVWHSGVYMNPGDEYRYGVTNWRAHEWCDIPAGTSE